MRTLTAVPNAARWVRLIAVLGAIWSVALPAARVFAAGVSAKLDSADGSTAFQVKDSADATVGRVDSDGNLMLIGSGTFQRGGLDIAHGSVTIRGSNLGLAVGATNFVVTSGGNTGIGTLVPGRPLDLWSTAPRMTDGSVLRVNGLLDYDASYQSGIQAIPVVAPSGASTSEYSGIKGAPASYTANLTNGSLTGVYGSVYWDTPANTLGSAYGLHVQIFNAQAGGTITNSYGLRIDRPSNAGTIGNNYGIYLDNQNFGANSYSMYSLGGLNYLAGNTGIGTSVPQAALHVATAGVPVGPMLLITTGTGVLFEVNRSSAVAFADFYTLGEGYKPGGGTWASSSDARLKKNIAPLESPLDKMLRLRGVTYEWIDPSKQGGMTGPQMGMIAQDVERVFPQWVGTGPDGFRSLAFRGFEALTVESIRELDGRVKALEDDNRELKRKNEQLEKRLMKLENRASKE